MKKRVFLFAAFFILAMVGCASVEETPETQRQEFKGGGEKPIGLPQRMGADVNDGQSEWPGDTVDNDINDARGDDASEVRLNAAAGGAAEGGSAAGEMLLLDIKSPVRRGEKGSLSIKGKPNESYTISSVFNNSGRSITAMAVKRTGADGTASWQWDVSKDTLPGTYGVMITGGGKLLTTSYTVQ